MLSADCRLLVLNVLPLTADAVAEKGWGVAGATNASAWNATDPSARAPHAAKFAICVCTL